MTKLCEFFSAGNFSGVACIIFQRENKVKIQFPDV